MAKDQSDHKEVVRSRVVVRFWGHLSGETCDVPNNYRVEVEVDGLSLLLDFRKFNFWERSKGCLPKDRAMDIGGRIAAVLGVGVDVEGEPPKVENYKE